MDKNKPVRKRWDVNTLLNKFQSEQTTRPPEYPLFSLT